MVLAVSNITNVGGHDPKMVHADSRAEDGGGFVS